jgi:Tfp pilus assembly protein PilN
VTLLRKSLLAVEVAGDEIRATVVQQRGKGIEIIDFSSMKRADPEDDLPSVEAIKALAQRLQRTGGPAVFVTPLARAFDLFMDRKKVAGLKHYQLLEAVKREVEPYTGISGVNALIGVEEERKPERRPGEVGAEDDEDQVIVNVSAMERNVYRAIKERFRAAGFMLTRIYPPDVSFYMPLLMDAMSSPRDILEVGQDYSNFAIIRGGIAKQINTLSLSLESIEAHLSGEVLAPDLEDSLRFTVRQTPVPEPLVVSGPGAAKTGIVDFISGFCPNGARALVLSRAAGIMDVKADPAHAAFGTVVGAAVRELRGGRERRIGIDDRAPLIPRLKKSAYMAPLATTVAILILLFGHYQYMKYKDALYKDRIVRLTEELKTRKSEIAEYDKLIKEADKLKEEISFAERKIAFIRGRADTDLGHIIACLNGIAGAVCDSLVLSSITQNGLHDYTVTGSAFDLPSVGDLATRLQKRDWCVSVVLQRLEKKTAEPSGLLDFEFSVKTQSEAA